MKRAFNLAGALITGLIGAFAQAGNLPAAAAPDYFKGKTLTILISSSPGGGTDTTGRLVAQFLPKYLPGNPVTVVQNMPGGGGTVANNHFYANAKPDGLTLLQDSSSAIGNFNRGGARIKYDPRKNRPVGSLARGGSVLMVRKEVKGGLTDPKGKKLVVGDTDGIRTWVAMTVWSAEYLNWNLRWLYGYKGSRELSLAMRQGEIDVWATQNAKLINDLRKEGVVELVYQQDEERRAEFPDVPTFVEYLGNKKPAGLAWEAYESWANSEDLDKFIIAPPKTPDWIVAALREAFMKMEKDEDFKAQANKFFGESWKLNSGEKTEAMIKKTTSISQPAQDFLTQLRKKYGLPVGAPAKS
jgi:tripartite-type tricarboxylate transporter receptor subunit TctC